MDIAQEDQMKAACAEVQTYVDQLSANPPPGAAIQATRDNAVHLALWQRLHADIDEHTVLSCCARVMTPRPLFWLPRHNAMMCEQHWEPSASCLCFEECDACRLPVDEVAMIWLFMGPYIVQAMLCGSCTDRLTVSPDRG